MPQPSGSEAQHSTTSTGRTQHSPAVASMCLEQQTARGWLGRESKVQMAAHSSGSVYVPYLLRARV